MEAELISPAAGLLIEEVRNWLKKRESRWRLKNFFKQPTDELIVDTRNQADCAHVLELMDAVQFEIKRASERSVYWALKPGWLHLIGGSGGVPKLSVYLRLSSSMGNRLEDKIRGGERFMLIRRDRMDAQHVWVTVARATYMQEASAASASGASVKFKAGDGSYLTHLDFEAKVEKVVSGERVTKITAARGLSTNMIQSLPFNLAYDKTGSAVVAGNLPTWKEVERDTLLVELTGLIVGGPYLQRSGWKFDWYKDVVTWGEKVDDITIK